MTPTSPAPAALPAAPAAAPAAVSARAERLRLRVQAPDGSVRWLEHADLSQVEATRRAVAAGLKVLAIETAQPARAAVAALGKARFPLLLFTQELLALLDAGLNLTEALATLHAKERQPLAHAVLGQVLQALREGRSFSEVLGTLPQHFPEVYAATVRASERTGDLPQALARYIAYQLQFDSLRKKLVSAAIYPVMLLAVGGFVCLFLLGYVVPRFSAVYESSGRELPWMSGLLLAFGKAIYGHWPAALAGAAAVLGAAGWAIGQPRHRAALLALVLRLPGLAQRADEFRLARFYRAVSLLLAAGIALPRAMGMVTGLLGPAQQARLAQARQAIEQGQMLSAALLAAHLASPVAESLIKVGERSGSLADMLERTARFQDEDFSRWVDWASRLIEPLLMALLGVVIGTVVVLMYMPIFDLAGSL
jgi:general secretion pathway protein F